MNYKLASYIIIVLIIVLAGCREPSTSGFDRNNPNDPNNSEFSLTTLDVKLQYSDKGHITLNWDNIENTFITSLVISKSLHEQQEYHPIDTISIENNSSFTDSSEQITLNTSYKIQGLRPLKETIKKAEPSIIKVNFEGFSTINSTLNEDSTSILFNWETITNWPYKIVFENHSTGEKDSVLSTQKNFAFSSYPDNFSNYPISVTMYLTTKSQNQSVDNTLFLYDRAMDEAPVFTGKTIIDEDNVSLSWTDNSSIEDGFKIFRSIGNQDNFVEIATLGPNRTTYTDSEKPFQNGIKDIWRDLIYQFDTHYKVVAFKNSSISSNDNTNIEIRVRAPQINNFSTSEVDILLTWSQPTLMDESISSQFFSNTIFVQRKSPSQSNFKTIAELSPSNNSFIDNDLSSSNEYVYRLTTTTNLHSETIRFANYPKFEETDSFNVPINPYPDKINHIRFSTNDKYIAVSNGFYNENTESTGLVYDLENRSVIYSDNPLSGSVTGIDVSEEQNLVALTSMKSRSLVVIDLDNNNVKFQAEDIPIYDVAFSPDGNSVYTAGPRSELSKFDLTSNNLLFTTNAIGPTLSMRRVSVSPTGDSIAINTAGNYRLYDSDGKMLSFNPLVDLGSTAHYVEFSSGGSYISSIRGFSRSVIQRTSDGGQHYSGKDDFIDVGEHTNSFITSNRVNDKILGTRFKVSYLELSTIKELSSLMLTEEVIGLKYSNQNRFFVVATPSGIRIYELSTETSWTYKTD